MTHYTLKNLAGAPEPLVWEGRTEWEHRTSSTITSAAWRELVRATVDLKNS